MLMHLISLVEAAAIVVVVEAHSRLQMYYEPTKVRGEISLWKAPLNPLSGNFEFAIA